MSMPPKRLAVSSRASRTAASSRTSTTSGSARPPAASISLAALYIVPASFGLASAVLAAMATLAPSRAARRPIARPMPRDAPVMNSVFPLSVGPANALPPFRVLRPERRGRRRPRRLPRLDRLLEPLDLGAKKPDALGELGFGEIVEDLAHLVAGLLFGLRAEQGLFVECRHGVRPLR